MCGGGFAGGRQFRQFEHAASERREFLLRKVLHIDTGLGECGVSITTLILAHGLRCDHRRRWRNWSASALRCKHGICL